MGGGCASGARWRALCAGLLLLTAALGACRPVQSPTAPAATATPVPAPSATVTPTVVWFPPTATHTPFPTPAITRTPDLLSGLGPSVLQDGFNDPQAWELPRSAAASASMAGGELSLAVVEPRVFLTVLRREPMLGDAYVEVTARTSLCMGLDEYGLLVRVSPDRDHYRFALSCDGQARLDRINGGSAANLVPWTLAGGAPVGAPGVARLAVWAQGEQLRFFVDGQLQFSASDPLLTHGTLGLFARSAGDSALTVRFSDLEVREVSAAPG